MKPRIVVIGAGGHSKVAIETLRQQGAYDILGLLDRDAGPREVLGLPVLGGDDLLGDLLAQGIKAFFPAIGDNAARVRTARQALDLGFQMVSAISPGAHVSPSAELGDGVLVVAGAVINAEARIGDMAIINTRAAVDHDADIGEGAHIAPGATLAGNVTVGQNAFVGAGATVLPKIRIGRNAIVGAGACVTRDIPANATAIGVPARTFPHSHGA